MNVNSHILAWMVAGDLMPTAAARDRRFEHLRALKDSPSRSTGFVDRLTAAITAVRRSTSANAPECCPA